LQALQIRTVSSCFKFLSSGNIVEGQRALEQLLQHASLPDDT
jgi:hypothetical protein